MNTISASMEGEVSSIARFVFLHFNLNVFILHRQSQTRQWKADPNSPFYKLTQIGCIHVTEWAGNKSWHVASTVLIKQTVQTSKSSESCNWSRSLSIISRPVFHPDWASVSSAALFRPRWPRSPSDVWAHFRGVVSLCGCATPAPERARKRGSYF